MLRLTDSQLAELRFAMHHAPKPHIRRKATALWNLGQGRSREEVSRILDVSLTSLSYWVNRYRSDGLEGLAVRPGRGRPVTANPEEIGQYLYQSPRNFGLAQTRWTLNALARVVPSLKGFGPSSVRQALLRYGYHYKRGQPHLSSPDPEYEEKRAAYWRRFEKPTNLLV